MEYIDPDQDGMTEVHIQARDHIIELIKKHFDGYLLLLRVDVIEQDGEVRSCAYGGGKTMAIGMATQFIHEALNEAEKEDQ